MSDGRHPDEDLVARWARACQAGDCRYPDPHRHPRRQEVATGCPGYLGTLHMESGAYVMRYRLCDRHLAWWEQERIRRRAQKKGQKIPRESASGWEARP